MITWDDILALGRELPETEESTPHVRPLSLKVRGKSFVTIRERPDALVVRCDGDAQSRLLARPTSSLTTPHYDGYPYVLVRLEAPLEEVRELVIDSWLLLAPKKLAAQFVPDPEAPAPVMCEDEQFDDLWGQKSSRAQQKGGRKPPPVCPFYAPRCESISTPRCSRVVRRQGSSSRRLGHSPRRAPFLESRAHPQAGAVSGRRARAAAAVVGVAIVAYVGFVRGSAPESRGAPIDELHRASFRAISMPDAASCRDGVVGRCTSAADVYGGARPDGVVAAGLGTSV